MFKMTVRRERLSARSIVQFACASVIGAQGLRFFYRRGKSAGPSIGRAQARCANALHQPPDGTECPE
jgi:hypothetical protein